MPSNAEHPQFEIRPSPIAGLGAFAVQPIKKGTRLIEYVGERISHEVADTRYPDDPDDRHVVLFAVNSKVVIDAGVDGNDARFINHSCDPNCEVIIENARVFIHSARDIAVGEELAYDYSLTRDEDDDDSHYPCNCGAPNCRGTMLEERKKPRRRRARTAARRKPAPRSRSRSREGARGRVSANAKRRTSASNRAPAKSRRRSKPGKQKKRAA